MRQWLARLGFSLIVLACVLAWEGYQASLRQAEPWRVWASYLGAAACLGVGLAGVRERHRRW